MKKTLKLISIFTMLLFVASCDDFSTDLNVENLENPNDQILTSDPVALEAIAKSLPQSWFMAATNYSAPGMSMATMSDIISCSWGNAGMRDTSSEPRVAFDNSAAYGSGFITNTFFNALYSVLADSNTLGKAIANGTEFDDPAKIEMMAKLGQALSIGYLAMVFDQVWLSDETGAVNEDASSSTYAEAMTFALNKLDEAISIANANNITLSADFIPGGQGANIVQFMNSLGARMLVTNVRNGSQKAAINWARVLAYTQNGITSDFEIYMDDVAWYDLVPKTYLVFPGWARVDMRVVNMMDPNTQDYWTDNLTFLPESTSADARLLTDYQYLSSNNFRPERGYYHFSNYRYSRYDDYITIWTMNTVAYSKSENDMYMAEAMAQMGNLQGAADVINAGTRVTRGNLPPVSANLAEISAAIHYERSVEFAYTSPYIGFGEMRKEDMLQPGTPLHFPVPGKALDAIPAPNYTFGGTTGVPGEDYSTGGWRN
jgi:hypothetical protein